MLAEKVIQSTSYFLIVILFSVCTNIKMKASEFQLPDHLAMPSPLLVFDVFFLKQRDFRKCCSFTLNNQVRHFYPLFQEFVCYLSSQAIKVLWKSCSDNAYFYIAAAALKLPNTRRL